MTTPQLKVEDSGERGRAPDAELGFELPGPPKVSGARVTGVILALLACAAVAFTAGYLPKRNSRAQLDRGSQAAAHELTSVSVVQPKLLRKDLHIVLPGSIQALAETTLYPQTNGYIRRFLVDIGERVQEGQLLAEIATPELDQELDQARAALLQSQASFGQAKASRDYANTS
jgi:membrane fusion protein (multidrug efflux system)